jgi:membrane protein YqaA with SNARE-associated domain
LGIIATVLAPRPKRRPSPSFTTTLLHHLGGFGLLLIAVVDSSPLPTFGGTDILTAILSARRVQPWYYFVAMATTGSVIGAYITFRAAQKAGSDYLERKFGKRKVSRFLETFEHWGTGGLAVSTAVPFPFPTSALFAAAGVLKYPTRKFLLVVAACRGARYAVIGLVAFHYGRHFIRVLRHPGQYYGWFIAIIIAAAGLVAAAFLVHRHLQPVNLTGSPQ